jgi:hypothetical protein
MFKQLHKHIKMLIVSEKCGTVYFSLACVYQLPDRPANIGCCSPAVLTETLTQISYIKNKMYV